MSGFLRWIEAAFAAVAFAEEGEVETARRLLAGGPRDEAPAREAPEPSPARAPSPPRRSHGRRKIARLP